jgi:hypothetical protein
MDVFSGDWRQYYLSVSLVKLDLNACSGLDPVLTFVETVNSGEETDAS